MLVTGAGGFIGSHLVEALVRAGARTRALVHYNSRGAAGHLDDLEPGIREQIEVVAGDVTDAVQMRELVAGCDIVFHLAALIAIPYSYKAVASYIAANVQGTYNVLEACRATGVGRLVHTSTSEVYGTAQYVPIDEQHPLNAQSPYAATKIAADQLAGSYHAAYGLPVVTVRPFNNFGPRQSARAVIPSIISQALASGRVELGSLDPVRDFLYVGDTARAYLAAGEAERRVRPGLQPRHRPRRVDRARRRVSRTNLGPAAGSCVFGQAAAARGQRSATTRLLGRAGGSRVGLAAGGLVGNGTRAARSAGSMRIASIIGPGHYAV